MGVSSHIGYEGSSRRIWFCPRPKPFGSKICVRDRSCTPWGQVVRRTCGIIVHRLFLRRGVSDETMLLLVVAFVTARVHVNSEMRATALVYVENMYGGAFEACCRSNEKTRRNRSYTIVFSFYSRKRKQFFETKK